MRETSDLLLYAKINTLRGTLVPWATQGLCYNSIKHK